MKIILGFLVVLLLFILPASAFGQELDWGMPFIFTIDENWAKIASPEAIKEVVKFEAFLLEMKVMTALTYVGCMQTEILSKPEEINPLMYKVRIRCVSWNKNFALILRPKSGGR